VSVTDIALLLMGVAALAGGGELLVRGASALARQLGVPSLVVGLTVVSFATSAPELSVTLSAAAADSPGLAIGNVVGSNIANILLILGTAAVLSPLLVRWSVVRRDVPVMIGISILLLLLALDGTLSTLEGLLLLSLVVGYTVLAVVRGRRSTARRVEVPAETERRGPADDLMDDLAGTAGQGDASADPSDDSPDDTSAGLWVNVLLVVVGVATLVLGAQLLVTAATSIAAALGLSDLVIGLTVVAIGTSMPELAASIVAVLRGETDLAVGNVVGSNIFNIGMVLGLTAVVSPTGIPVADAAVTFDLPIMIAVSFALLPVVFTGLAIGRVEGAMFLGFYVAYTAYILLDAADHDALPPYSAVMAWFVIPLTAITLAVLALFEVNRLRDRRARLLGEGTS
jgi:cation:H+ antiporter